MGGVKIVVTGLGGLREGGGGLERHWRHLHARARNAPGRLIDSEHSISTRPCALLR